MEYEYTQKFMVYRHDGDCYGRIKPGALLRYAQQVATENANASGLTDAAYAQTHTAHLLAKLALHQSHPIMVDETLTVTTKPEKMHRAVNKRITVVQNEEGTEVATLDSRWVLVDTEKRTILRSRPQGFEDACAETVPYELPLKIKKPALEQCENLGGRIATYSQCDKNGHLNNTRYADIVCDALPLSVWVGHTVEDFVIHYHREIPQGEGFTLYRCGQAENNWYVCGIRQGKLCFEAALTLR